MSTSLNEEYLTVAETAKTLKVSLSTVWRWIDSGQLPAYRVGQRRVRLKKDEVTRLITPAREGKEKGAGMVQKERPALRSLTRKEQKQALDAIEDAKRLQSEMLARRGGRLFPSSSAILEELREQRTRDLAP